MTKWVNQLIKAVENYSPDVVNSKCIVEPWGKATCSEYWEFMEADPDNWAAFVKECLGTDWGDIAIIVNEEGY